MQMTKQMYTLMEYLAQAEGTIIHYNSMEHDITSMYGIYRHAHPSAAIFKEIDYLTFKLGIKEESCNWQEKDLDFINNYINKDEKLNDKFLGLAIDFYKDYLRLARLEMFHKDCVIAMFSMYTNSPKLAWKSVQYAINTMNRNGFVDYKRTTEDGIFGSNTQKGLDKCLYACNTRENVGLLFESYMLLGMCAEYSLLIKSNPEKYMIYSIGWDNRMKELQGRR